MREEWRSIDQRIKGYDDELAERVHNEEAAKRLTRIPGIGVLTASALVAAVGNAQTFSCGPVTPQLGWDWCRARRRQVENRGCCASARGYCLKALRVNSRTRLAFAPGDARYATP